MNVNNKKIILAVSASIAAYKTPELVRLLVKAGAEVQVLMTPAAADFVTPLSLATVSKKEVFANVSNHAQWNNHVHLGRWADVLLIAPCSANTLAKMANGLCDNIVQAVYLSATCPVLVAPAMDDDMWHHPATKANLATIQAYGNKVIAPEHGELASGIVGMGRMADPVNILAYLNTFFEPAKAVQNHFKRALITAGPTYEKLDPVRFIGNYSTGKMGIAFARVLAEQGTQVDLVLGPTSEQVAIPGVEVHPVESAQEMYDKCLSLYDKADIAIMTAAVADFRPVTKAGEKIKKKEGDEHMLLELVKNPDILATLGSLKKEQILVGFALETNNELENAKKKLQKKNADYIVLNSLNDSGAGFGQETNKVSIISAQHVEELPLQSKYEVAQSVIKYLISQ
ncbi:MAG: phosphopantothenoylcysteine decarboxylase [Bacteroidetes bacterium 43-16]|nr:MAG: phosphopantothenoylcysteine decarboxylase [Bacteroidetes bacterium 43-16]